MVKKAHIMKNHKNLKLIIPTNISGSGVLQNNIKFIDNYKEDKDSVEGKNNSALKQ
jgi:hypothetical protein